MKQSKTVVDRNFVVEATAKKIEQIEKVLKKAENYSNPTAYALDNSVSGYTIKATLALKSNLQNDPHKEDRIKKSLCLCCYYKRGMRIGMAAITSKECGLCDTVVSYGSSATDNLCEPCAISNGLCKQCGADVTLNVKTDKYPFEK